VFDAAVLKVPDVGDNEETKPRPTQEHDHTVDELYKWAA
jgi:hypothetical protein